MAQKKAQASELARQAVARGEHSINRASKRQEVIDSGLEMADRLVQAQYGFLRSLVHTAGSVVSRPDNASGEPGGD
jgi:hypothetical protein